MLWTLHIHSRSTLFMSSCELWVLYHCALTIVIGDTWIMDARTFLQFPNENDSEKFTFFRETWSKHSSPEHSEKQLQRIWHQLNCHLINAHLCTVHTLKDCIQGADDHSWRIQRETTRRLIRFRFGIGSICYPKLMYTAKLGWNIWEF